ncbi:MAG: hypothetical protein QF704_12550, partial [Anaerolineales bacterium]|nr:hypothetical protein [Anaerolineales bacterium]
LKLTVEMTKQVAGQLNNLFTISDNYAQAELNNIRKKKDADILALDEMGLSAVEHQNRKDKIEADALEEEKIVKRKQKKLAKAMAIVKGATAVMDTWEVWGGWPAGIIPAGIMAGITLSEVALIESQTFAHGGMVSPRKFGGDSVPAMLTPREIVSTQGASDIYGDEIIRMNQLADGEVTSPMGMGGAMNVTIQALDAGSFEDYIRANPNALANALDFLKDKRYIT